MQFITGNNRHQSFFSKLEEQVAADNPVRLIDAFIDKLDLAKMGFTSTVHKRILLLLEVPCTILYFISKS